MRSDLVFGAMTHVPNRYLLTALASKAARKLHRRGTRMQDTANSVLAHFRFNSPLREKHVASTPPVVQIHEARPRGGAIQSNDEEQNAA
jgi:hypothetical protein